MHSSLRSLAVFLLASTFRFEAIVAIGEEIAVCDDTQLAVALRSAKPGTTIRIAPGRYRGGHSVQGLRGTAEAPIRITADDPEDAPVIEGGSNAFHFSGVAWLTVESLIISGSQYNGLNLDDGGKGNEPSHHLTLRNLSVRNVGSDGNHDGLKLSGVNDFEIIGCDFSKWGRGGSAIDMVGCHDGRIEGCFFLGRESDAGNGVQAKGGSSRIKIVGCRFEHVGSRAVNLGGSTGLPYFRPIDAPFEAKDLTVEDCVFIGSPAPIAFVGVDGAIVRRNTIYDPGKYVVRILQENDDDRFVPARNGMFERNLIVFNAGRLGSTTNVGPNTRPETFEYRQNAWVSTDRRGRKPRHDIRERSGTFDKLPTFVYEDAGDFTQTEQSQTHGFGARDPRATKPYPGSKMGTEIPDGK